MGCRESLDEDPDRRQYLKNSKRDEEVEDVADDDDDADMYFEIEQTSKATNLSLILESKLTIILLAITWKLTYQ